LDANNLPESLAQKVRLTFQPWDRWQCENVFILQLSLKGVMLSVADA